MFAAATADEVDAPAQALHSELLEWYRTHARSLPWRTESASPWSVLICEVMSQQTPIARLIPTWERWLHLWPTPTDLAAARSADVIREWGTLGYPRRALWLKQAATVIRDKHGGNVPRDYASLRELPGIGDYTASAVCAFAFDQAIPVLDTNVRRVFARLMLGVPAPTSSAPTRAEKELATRLMPAHDSATWSVAVMEYGSLVCRATGPNCTTCVLASHCRWFQSGSPAARQVRPKQRFAGTDRQVRGKVLALLRARSNPATDCDLRDAWPDDAQRTRCIASLINDGLVERTPTGYQLPTS